MSSLSSDQSTHGDSESDTNSGTSSLPLIEVASDASDQSTYGSSEPGAVLETLPFSRSTSNVGSDQASYEGSELETNFEDTSLPLARISSIASGQAFHGGSEIEPDMNQALKNVTPSLTITSNIISDESAYEGSERDTDMNEALESGIPEEKMIPSLTERPDIDSNQWTYGDSGSETLVGPETSLGSDTLVEDKSDEDSELGTYFPR